MVAALPSPSPAAPAGKVATLLLLYLRFSCGVAGDEDLPLIRKEVVRGKVRKEGISTLNQNLMMVLLSCQWLFGGRAHFCAFLPLLGLVKNVSLWNPSVDPA